MKTKANAKDRNEILNAVRKELGEQFLFVVYSLNVTEKYAWFTGERVRKDGKVIESSEYQDCCHL